MRLSLGITPKSYFSLAAANDVDAQAFIDAAGITDATQKSAVNQLVLDLKSANIWTKMKAIYPIVGGSASSHKWNLKNPLDTNAAFRLSFSTGWTHASTGMTPNGTSAYADTFLNTLTNIPNAGHISYYSRTQTISNTQTDIGNLNNIAPTSSNFIASTATINVGYYGNTSNFTQQNISDKRGYVISSKTSSTSLKLYNNGSLVSTDTSSNTVSAPNINLYIGSRNNNGTAETYSVKQLALVSIGDGLTDAEASNLYTAVQNYQTTLGRNV